LKRYLRSQISCEIWAEKSGSVVIGGLLYVLANIGFEAPKVNKMFL
jgi:hypothetical protein